MNEVKLIGRLTKDINLRFLPKTGVAVGNFTIAVNEGYGEVKKAYFFNCEIWGNKAIALAENKGKGDKILVNGKLKQVFYDKNEKKCSKIFVQVGDVNFM